MIKLCRLKSFRPKIEDDDEKRLRKIEEYFDKQEKEILPQ